jgi:hypothetical protein
MIGAIVAALGEARDGVHFHALASTGTPYRTRIRRVSFMTSKIGGLARKGAIIVGAALALTTFTQSAYAWRGGCWGCGAFAAGAIAGAALSRPYYPPVYYAPPVVVAPRPVAPIVVAPAPVYPVCPALPPYPYYCR